MSSIDTITGKKIINEGGRGGPLTEDHQGMRARHEDDLEWTNLRYEGQFAKMMFHPTAEDPTIPNAGIVRYEKGSGHPLHNHYFAQIWYILDGKFLIEGKLHGKGSMIFHPDPHFESKLETIEAGTILYVQYVGPHTRQGAIYEGRFNVSERKSLAEETTAV
ncbi:MULTISPECIES: cupin domain-containing protein [Achromobacter]|uniref:cupin domain-containing protein n=1 Tax=Achromobacter TaxID=222 RepID=UPI00244ADDD6|nr:MULTISPECIES: cupin domain-containing protein [Achromobacter]MDH1301663.1 cupin domain-containing protein [Achromobacter sp. GD03932]WLW62554.1 cupin domain-containing protein [Achromobacter aegrifaciens]